VPSDPDSLAHVQQNFVRHILPLRGFLLALLPRPDLADDVVQETFLTACERADTYTPGTNFRAWIYTIARYKALAAIRRSAGRCELLDPDLVDLLVEDHVDDTRLSERVAALDICVEKLAPAARQAIPLRYTEELGPTAIAERTGWSPNAVNVALSRARDFLRRCAEEQLRQRPAVPVPRTTTRPHRPGAAARSRARRPALARLARVAVSPACRPACQQLPRVLPTRRREGIRGPAPERDLQRHPRDALDRGDHCEGQKVTPSPHWEDSCATQA
jgi:RNA polymerase sigma-70 factor (ECF subfamily)